MRIIGGKFRGRKLISPTDRKIRPTTDRMREDIFNILEHSSVGIEGATVLDMFAGTGALGLEALSRGAASVSFFDRDKSSLNLVKKNITLLEVEDNTTIKCVISPNLPASAKAYDFIFIDPPYNLDLIEDTLAALIKKNYFSENSIITIELSRDRHLALPGNITLLKEKKYGESRILILKFFQVIKNLL